MKKWSILVISLLAIALIISLSSKSSIDCDCVPIECEDCKECLECEKCLECQECLGYNYSLGHDCINPKTTPVNPIPIRYKASVFEDYCNYEIRCAFYWAREYLSRPDLFKLEEHHLYNLWDDYRYRVCPNADNDTRMYYYNYWIISYSVGI